MVKARVQIEYNDPGHASRVNEILADGVVTDAEGAELLLMKARELPAFEEARRSVSVRVNDTTRSKVIWALIVGMSIAIIAIYKLAQIL